MRPVWSVVLKKTPPKIAVVIESADIIVRSTIARASGLLLQGVVRKRVVCERLPNLGGDKPLS